MATRSVVFDLMFVRALAQEALGQRSDLHDFLVGLISRLDRPVVIGGKSTTLRVVVPYHAEKHVVRVLRRDYAVEEAEAAAATSSAIHRLAGTSGLVAKPPRCENSWSPYNTGAEDHKVLQTARDEGATLLTADKNLRRWAFRENIPAFAPGRFLELVEPDLCLTS